MKTLPFAFLVAVVVVAAGPPRLAEAQAARFRYIASVYADSQGTGLNLPEGIACGADGQIVIGDTGNDRLLRFTYRDKTFSGGAEIKSPQLSAPSRVRINSKGEIYALDSKQRRLVHLAADGEVKEVIGFNAVEPSSTVVPKAFAIDQADNIYVLDVFSARVLVLNPQGQFQKSLPFPDDSGFISDVAVDSVGNIFLVDSVKRRLFSAGKDAAAFTPVGGDLTQYIGTMPSYLTTSKGTILVVEGSGSRIIGFGRDGSFLTRQLTLGWNEGALNHPEQICVSDKDEAFIADRDNSRVQVFQLMR
jgi:DNA-binding beta-propeller fold protein YncE